MRVNAAYNHNGIDCCVVNRVLAYYSARLGLESRHLSKMSNPNTITLTLQDDIVPTGDRLPSKPVLASLLEPAINFTLVPFTSLIIYKTHTKQRIYSESWKTLIGLICKRSHISYYLYNTIYYWLNIQLKIIKYIGENIYIVHIVCVCVYSCHIKIINYLFLFS